MDSDAQDSLQRRLAAYALKDLFDYIKEIICTSKSSTKILIFYIMLK